MNFLNHYACLCNEQASGNSVDQQLVGGVAWIEHGHSSFTRVEIWEMNEQFFICTQAKDNQRVQHLPDVTITKALSMLEEISNLYSRMSYLHRYTSVEERDKLAQHK